MAEDTFEVRIASLRDEAPRIRSFVLEPMDGRTLPDFTAGSHVDCHLPDGLVRSYSLLNAPGEGHYVIGVARDERSRGGSRGIHETWRAGDTIRVSAPRNTFPMAEDAAHSVFVAGGIGITPLLSMIARLDALGRGWELHYAVRAPDEAALLDRIRRAGVDHPGLHVFVHHAEDATRLDVAKVVREAPSEAHLYCCGPPRMLEAFSEAAIDRPADHLHVEYFAPREEAATAGGYEVVCDRTGVTVQVQPGQRMLDALLDAGLMISYSCSEGMCGTCETKVLEGVPDHRDEFLSDEEKASNTLVMPCCSGSKTGRLVIDA